MTTQGNRYIVVEIPGKSRRDLVETVKRQAQLRFRLVACSRRPAHRCRPQRRPAPADPARRLARRRRAAARAPTATPDEPTEQPTATPTTPRRGAPEPPTAAPRRQARPPEPAAPSAPSTGPRRRRVDRRGSPTTDARPTAPSGARRRRPAEVDRQPRRQVAVDAYNAFTCPPTTRRTSTRPARPSLATTRRPLVTCDDQGHEVPALRRDDRGHRPRRRPRRHPAEPGQLGRQPRLQRRRHRRRSPRSPGALLRHPAAVRDRPRRPGDLRARP